MDIQLGRDVHPLPNRATLQLSLERGAPTALKGGVLNQQGILINELTVATFKPQKWCVLEQTWGFSGVLQSAR